MPRRQFRQFEEIFEPRDRTALRLFNECSTGLASVHAAGMYAVAPSGFT